MLFPAIVVFIVIFLVGAALVFLHNAIRNARQMGLKAYFMRNAVCVIIVSTLLVMIVGDIVIGKIVIRDSMWDYLEDNGYRIEKVESLTVKHSYFSALLSYDEWIIHVIYDEYDDSTKERYSFTYKNGEIVESGISWIPGE